MDDTFNSSQDMHHLKFGERTHHPEKGAPKEQSNSHPILQFDFAMVLASFKQLEKMSHGIGQLGSWYLLIK
ncbi:hypothetical protein CEXT_299031 [Caerostris extrusa]|uniref:Uncharacterized protein n=1 Tax=Caerostris extrusa TaxID=172846 RepID=A0AAV4V3P4_CAEEX|nr:hypothetical protein CEXT_299031 [Caerostris extrusa]